MNVEFVLLHMALQFTSLMDHSARNISTSEVDEDEVEEEAKGFCGLMGPK